MAHDMQVEIEGDPLPQPPTSSADQQSMLGLGQTEVVNGSQQVTLEAPLTDKQLVQEGQSHGLSSGPSEEAHYFKCANLKLASAVYITEISKYSELFLSFFLVTDSFVNTQHALPQNITQFETPALSQPPFDQQTLTQGTKLYLLSV